MASKIWVAYLLVILLLSCSERKVPAALINEPTMVNLLIELHLCEAKVNALKLPKDSSKMYYEQYRDSIYTKFGVADSMVVQSYEYYQEDLNRLDAIYLKVVDSLSLLERMQADIDTMDKKEKRNQKKVKRPMTDKYNQLIQSPGQKKKK